jgi:broad specificity phosphatase PhoE
MKKILLVVVLFFGVLSACTSQESTTYYLIRHAEKNRTDKTNRNPDLNKKGVERAKKWASYFKNIKIDAVYATDYKRTQQTASPTAKSKEIGIQSYNPTKMYDAIFQQNTKGKTVLVVGHSNTTPDFVNKILGEKKYDTMNDTDNASLYIVTISGDSTAIKIEEVN